MELKSLVPLSLQKVIDQKPQWTLGVGRLYGEGIDEVLIKNNYKKNPKIKVVDNSLLAHQMLHTGRIQYTLGYPFEAFYYNKLLKSPGSVEYLPLKDNGDFVYVVVACPKNEWGKNVIESVNLVLNNSKVLDEIRRGVDRWLSINDQNILVGARRKMIETYYPDLTK
ncbi:hypothetical protein [Bdellovibrio sp. HCB288]|uniref:hypothetical protein n=1 Tax=Bdellovibrio sp. HCB288 TaxID=3394355 RepID=UPI0039B3DF41